LRVFDSRNSALLDIYKHALETDSAVHDGMLVSLRVAPGGEVTAGAVKVSTTSNPSLDAEVVKVMMDWRFNSFKGGSVEVFYPLIFAHDSSDEASVEAELAPRVASLNGGEAPEYAFAAATPQPTTVPPAETATGGTESAPGGPTVAMTEPEKHEGEGVGKASHERSPAVEPEEPEAEEPARAGAPPKTELARLPAPPTLTERVEERMHGNRKFNHVKVSASGGTVTLYGKVFDDDAKSAAVRTARNVEGVSNVVDTLTTETSEWTAQENRIGQELANAGLSKVTVKVIGGDAYLEGEVTSEAEKNHAATIAESAAPVKVRTNLIKVTSKGLFGF
jgi:hypothetical protein